MHELSLCRAIADVATDNAGGKAVSRVSVQIGHFRQVVPDTLRFCWTLVTEGTALDGCELAIEHVPAVVVCRACGADTQLDRPVLACGTCASRDVELRSGEEFLVASIDILEVI